MSTNDIETIDILTNNVLEYFSSTIAGGSVKIDTVDKIKTMHNLLINVNSFILQTKNTLTHLEKIKNIMEMKKECAVQQVESIIQYTNLKNNSFFNLSDDNIYRCVDLDSDDVESTRKDSVERYVTIGGGRILIPQTSNIDKITPMRIEYLDKNKIFTINLNGRKYSFGDGNIVYKNRCRNKHNLYGKYCNQSRDGCCDVNCTYYHDPILCPNKTHSVRNMSVKYILETLLKSVSCDNDMYKSHIEKNRFIVRDLVQLGGLLILKAAVLAEKHPNQQ